MYSELFLVKICFAFEESSSRRDWARVTSYSYLRCLRLVARGVATDPTPWLPVDTTRTGRLPSDGRCSLRYASSEGICSISEMKASYIATLVCASCSSLPFNSEDHAVSGQLR